jgi:hypothetical protein
MLFTLYFTYIPNHSQLGMKTISKECVLKCNN